MVDNSTKTSIAMGSPFYKSLHFQVLVAIIVGVALGYFQPKLGVALQPLGDGFVRLIKMRNAPVLF
jgi:aerobic C4-dicarboxylate transport protein